MVKSAIKMTIEGKRYVAIPEAEYNRMAKAQSGAAKLPKADKQGRRPALETLDAMVGQDVHQAREDAGMTQAQLAEASGVRVETISRIEGGHHSPSVRTLRKLGQAMGLDW